MVSAAVFQLTRQNLLVPDPQDASRAFNIQAGKSVPVASSWRREAP